MKDVCVLCGAELETTDPKFTGICNDNKGQYIEFYFCPNDRCARYRLYCDHSVHEKR